MTEWITVPQYALITGITPSYIYRQIRDGKMQSEERDGKKYVLYSTDDDAQPIIEPSTAQVSAECTALQDRIKELEEKIEAKDEIIAKQSSALASAMEKLTKYLDFYEQSTHPYMLESRSEPAEEPQEVHENTVQVHESTEQEYSPKNGTVHTFVNENSVQDTQEVQAPTKASIGARIRFLIKGVI